MSNSGGGTNVATAHSDEQHSGTGDGNSGNEREGEASSRSRRNRWRRGDSTSAGNTSHSRFTGKCTTIKEHVYDTGMPNSNQDLFATTTNEIAEYVAREYENAGEFRNGLPALKMPALAEPEEPSGENPSVRQLEVFKLKLRQYY